MSLRPGSLAALVLATGPLAAQRTWSVPGDLDTITEAVQAAAPGDRILLTSTTPYGSGADTWGIVVDKALTIEPVEGQRATLRMDSPMLEAFRLESLGGGTRFLLRNLDIVPVNQQWAGFTRTNRYTCLRIELDLTERGTIVLDGVTAAGLESNADDPCPALVSRTGPGVRLELRGCQFTGATGDVAWVSRGEVGWDGSPGAVIDHAGAGLIQDCTFYGGQGGYAWWFFLSAFPAKNGGAGLVLRGSDCALIGSAVRDGDGGSVGGSYSGSYDPCLWVGEPGESLLQADLFEVYHEPAAVGSAPGCPGSRPPAVTLGATRDLTVASSQQHSTAPFSVTTQPLATGEGASALLFGASLRPLAVPGWRGRLYTGDMFLAVPVVAPQPGGVVAVQIAAAASLTEDAELALQLVHLPGSTPSLQMGAPLGVTLLTARP